MSRAGPGRLPLLLVAAGFAVAVGLWVALAPVEDLPLRSGTPAPDFELRDMQGRPYRLSDQRGRVVFVNLWATWCAPCRDEAPALERLYQQLRGDGFEVLAVNIDAPGNEAAVRAFRDELSLTFPILMDPDQRVYAAYQATGVPETFVVDASGELRERYVGPRTWDEPRYARAVERLLAASRP